MISFPTFTQAKVTCGRVLPAPLTGYLLTPSQYGSGTPIERYTARRSASLRG
jgi:hypothetical protein